MNIFSSASEKLRSKAANLSGTESGTEFWRVAWIIISVTTRRFLFVIIDLDVVKNQLTIILMSLVEIPNMTLIASLLVGKQEGIHYSRRYLVYFLLGLKLKIEF